KDLPWAPDGRTALEMTCLRMLAFSPRRDSLHPASLTALPPSMTSSAASSATPVASLPGKRPAAESAALAPISGAVPAPLASPVATSVVPAVDVSLPAMTDDIGNPADSEEEAQAAELFSQQDELLREAAGMGYQPEPALTLAQPDVSAHSAAQPADADEQASAAAYADHSRGESLTASIEPALEPTTTPVSAPEAVSAVSSMQSLLGKRNMLRSRQRGQDAPAVPAPRAVPVAPAKPVAPAAAPVVTQQPAPASQPAGQGVATTGHYDELPPVDLYGDGYEPQGDNGDYEEYLNQGFAEQTPVISHASVTAPAQPSDLPPWDLDGQPSYRPGEHSATAPAVTPTPATQPPVASTAVAAALVTQDEPPQPVMETIDWDELESDEEPQEGEATRLVPSSLLNGCGDPWAELIAHTQVGGRLRQLAINSVMTREGDKVLLT
ncbi:MAG: DNA polymerase III subunit gamma/tau, partial [Aeromonas veronii]